MPPVTASGNELSRGSLIALLVFTGVSACSALCFAFAFLYFAPSLQNDGENNTRAHRHNHGPRPHAHSHAPNTGNTKTRMDDVESRIGFEVPVGSPDTKIDVDDRSLTSDAVPRPTSQRFSTPQHAPVGHVQTQPSDSLSISTVSSMEHSDRGLPSPSSTSLPAAPQATYTLADAAKKLFRGHTTDNNDRDDDGDEQPQYARVYPPPIPATPASAPATSDAFTINSTL